MCEEIFGMSEKLKIANARRLMARIRLNKYIDENYKEIDKELIDTIQYYLRATDLRDEALNEIELNNMNKH